MGRILNFIKRHKTWSIILGIPIIILLIIIIANIAIMWIALIPVIIAIVVYVFNKKGRGEIKEIKGKEKEEKEEKEEEKRNSKKIRGSDKFLKYQIGTLRGYNFGDALSKNYKNDVLVNVFTTKDIYDRMIKIKNFTNFKETYLNYMENINKYYDFNKTLYDDENMVNHFKKMNRRMYISPKNILNYINLHIDSKKIISEVYTDYSKIVNEIRNILMNNGKYSDIVAFSNLRSYGTGPITM